MPKAIVSTQKMTESEWLNFRRNGIGGSDAAAIAGVSPWFSPIDVYLDKIGEAPEKDLGEYAYWGHVLENVVAEEFSKRTGLKVRQRHAILQDDEYPWMLANIDRLIIGKREGLECKTTSAWMKNSWDGDKIPNSYVLQCQHYMKVTGFQAWWIAVLIGGNTFKYQRIERDEALIADLVKIEKDFWENHVIPRVMPAPDGSTACSDLLAKLYPNGGESPIELPESASELIVSYKEYQEREKRYKTLKDEAGNKLKIMLEEHESGKVGKFRVSWKPIESHRFDTNQFKADHPDLHQKYLSPSSYRRFTVK